MSRTHPDRAARTIRARQRELWASAVDDWHGFDPSTEELTHRLIAAAGVRRGDRVIDLACGTGMPALAEASVVGDEGRVLGLDLVPEMILIARAEASARGFHNVEFRTIETEEDLGVPDDSFDAATCKHGLMWMPRPLAAVEALYSALKVGGRLAISSWCDISRNSLLSIVPQVARKHVVLAGDWPAGPPSPLQSPESLVSLLCNASFIDVRCERVFLTWDDGQTVDEYVRDALQDDETLVEALNAAPTAVHSALELEIFERVRALFPSGHVVVELETLVASGKKIAPAS